jgi:hypothetical protein
VAAWLTESQVRTQLMEVDVLFFVLLCVVQVATSATDCSHFQHNSSEQVCVCVRSRYLKTRWSRLDFGCSTTEKREWDQTRQYLVSTSIRCNSDNWLPPLQSCQHDAPTTVTKCVQDYNNLWYSTHLNTLQGFWPKRPKTLLDHFSSYEYHYKWTVSTKNTVFCHELSDR